MKSRDRPIIIAKPVIMRRTGVSLAASGNVVMVRFKNSWLRVPVIKIRFPNVFRIAINATLAIRRNKM
jgi:hypothetical protein